MDIGICMPQPTAELASALREAGCDYYEPAMASAVMRPDAASFETSIADWSVAGLAPRSANVLLPGELKVVGESVDQEGLRRYLGEATRRARLLGLEVLVFGSGEARRAPEGFPPNEALRQFGEALRLAAESASPGAVIAAEHLRSAETNVMNSLAEAAALVREVDAEGLALVVDGYHLDEQHEDVGVVRDAGPLIRHVHVAGPGRRAPAPGDGDYLAPLFAALAEIGYSGRCSIECRWEDLASQGPPALEAVRSAAEKAGLA